MREESTPAPDCRIRQIDFYGWQDIELSNGIVDVMLVPEIGGRIMAYRLGSFSPLRGRSSRARSASFISAGFSLPG